jgi:hypothetical protein
MAAIFTLQGLTSPLPDSALHDFAFRVLGNLPERICLDALAVCLLAVCLLDSRGRTRIFGLLSLLAVAAVELYQISLLFSGTQGDAILRLVYLLPLVWLLLESRKERSPGVLDLREQVA